MANILPNERRVEVLGAIVNGSSIRGESRRSGVHQDTIGRLVQAVGEGCERLHDRLIRDLTCPLVDLDEQHSWCGKRQVHVDPERDDLSRVGEQWIWAAICRTSKLVIAWRVGKHTQEVADDFVADVRARLRVMPQITTDGLKLYLGPIAINFGPGVDYAQTVKKFVGRGGKPGTSEKYAVNGGVEFVEKRRIYGAPDFDRATTYAIERSNLTNRQWNARLGRRTLCGSRKLERHRAAIALMFVYRGFCHIQQNMRVTPAMAANVTDHVWSLDELMQTALAEPEGAKPQPQPLASLDPSARQLPNDRGFMRVVRHSPKPPPVHPGQLSFAWPQKPPEVSELSFFDD